MSFFITFEGTEGSGKTTVIKSIYDFLIEKGYKCLITREPGGIDIAEQIRNIILDVKNTKMDSRTEALLYAASRVQHLSEKVIPALENGTIVLCDRYLDSSLVYQGIARNLGIDNVLDVNKFALEYMPNLTIFLDVNPEVGLARIKSNNRDMNRLDLEKLEFHYQVYEGYKKISKMYPNRIKNVNGEQEIEKVINDCIIIVNELLGDNND